MRSASVNFQKYFWKRSNWLFAKKLQRASAFQLNGFMRPFIGKFEVPAFQRPVFRFNNLTNSITLARAIYLFRLIHAWKDMLSFTHDLDCEVLWHNLHPISWINSWSFGQSSESNLFQSHWLLRILLFKNSKKTEHCADRSCSRTITSYWITHCNFYYLIYKLKLTFRPIYTIYICNNCYAIFSQSQ